VRCFVPIVLYRCPCWAARYQFSKQTTDPLRLTLLLCSFELLNHLFPKLKQLWEKRFNHVTQHQIFSEPTNPTGFWAWSHNIPQSILQHFRANIPMFVGSGWSTPHGPPWPLAPSLSQLCFQHCSLWGAVLQVTQFLPEFSRSSVETFVCRPYVTST
jgi:hypothetical protein